MSGRHKTVERIPGIVKISGVVSVGPTTWWSLTAKKLLAAHMRLCFEIVKDLGKFAGLKRHLALMHTSVN
jgi:hypothetical protein